MLAVVAASLVFLMAHVIVLVIQMLAVDVAKLVLQAVIMPVVQQLKLMNAAYVVVTVLLMAHVTVLEIQMLAVDVAKLVLQAVIMPVVQQLQMMNAAYVVVITHHV